MPRAKSQLKTQEPPMSPLSTEALLAQIAALSDQVRELAAQQAQQSKQTPSQPAETPPPQAAALSAEALVDAIAKATRPNQPGGRVGVRNISNTVIGFPTPEGDVQLLCQVPGIAEPRVAAEIPYSHWQVIRKGSLVEQGLVVRDDSILDLSAPRAPEDRPTDLAPGFTVNAIEDAHAFITSKTEEELETAIMRITSEPSLSKLLVAVTQKIYEIGEKRFKGDDQRGKKAIRALPALYRKAEECALDRLEELRPGHGVVGEELNTKIRF